MLIESSKSLFHLTFVRPSLKGIFFVDWSPNNEMSKTFVRTSLFFAFSTAVIIFLRLDLRTHQLELLTRSLEKPVQCPLSCHS